MNSTVSIAERTESIWRDLHYATRLLVKKPLLTFTAILTIAIGIGANTAIFTVINSVLLEPLPYPDSNRLAVIWSTFGREGHSPSSGPELVSLRERSRLFDQFAGIWVKGGALTENGDPEQVKLGWVTSNFLSLLSSRPESGRFFLPNEDGTVSAPVAVLSYELWQRRFGLDPKVVGRAINLNGQLFTVVGILRPGFKLFFPEGAGIPPNVDVYAPFRWDLSRQKLTQGYIRLIGRLQKGATIQQAQSELDNIAAQWRSEFVEYAEQNLHLQALSLQGDVARNARPALLAVFGATGFVLLIVCANVAMLLLSRAGERQNEMILRAALGADPGRIVRQLLTESLLLSFLGGIAGLAVCWGILKTLWILQPGGIARATPSGFSLTVLGFNFIVSAICGLLFGLYPALRSKTINLASMLREASPTTAPDRHLSRRLLIGGEVALTFILLTSSILLLGTFLDLLRVNPGFQANNVLTFQVSLPPIRYGTADARNNFIHELQRKIAALPAVQSVGVVSHLPFDDTSPNWYSYFWREGAPEQERNALMADHRSVLPEFFNSLGITFVAGRNFDTSDEVVHRKAVIIDDSLAKQLWPDGNEIGQKINIENGSFLRDIFEVIGVIKHVQYHSLTNQVRPQVYLPYVLAPRPEMSLTVRMSSSPELLLPLIRQAVANLDRDLPLAKVRMLDDYVADARRETRFVTVLFESLAGIALLLSCVGIYGVTFSIVTGRTKEIGIRIAMGAQKHNITMMVLPGSMVPVILGALLGLALSLVVTPLLSTLLYGVKAIEPLVMLAVLLTLCLIGLLASLVPTWIVVRANPISALRSE